MTSCETSLKQKCSNETFWQEDSGELSGKEEQKKKKVYQRSKANNMCQTANLIWESTLLGTWQMNMQVCVCRYTHI